MQVAIALFEGITALDAVGPYEVLQRLPGATVHFVGAEVKTVRTDNAFLGLSVDEVWEDVPNPDVVVVPGGVGVRALLPDPRALAWLRAAHAASTWTTSVCTGSLFLAAAGLLDGRPAATHWANHDELAALGAIPTSARVVEHPDARIITAAGVSSGIDMALRLSELLFDEDAARAMQLMIEYDPQPPFDSGHPDRATPEVMARVVEYSRTKK